MHSTFRHTIKCVYDVRVCGVHVCMCTYEGAWCVCACARLLLRECVCVCVCV